MYKRRFSAPPLHPTASKSVTGTATAPQQQPSVPASITSQQQTTTLAHGHPTSNTTTASTNTGKENAVPVVPNAGAAKKPRLFVRPASSAAGTGAGTSAPAFHRPTPAAAPASSDSSAPPSRIFSVLYCKRDKFKVCCIILLHEPKREQAVQLHHAAGRSCVMQLVLLLNPCAEEERQGFPGRHHYAET